jgi:two-component system response regulator HydG
MNNDKSTILVVDDEVDTCRNLSDILTDLGYRADTAYSGFAALELVKKNTYDIAVLDLKMPGMDGLELYRQIKKLQSDTVAIVVTAYATSAAAEEALTAGAWRVLTKPLEFSTLLSLMETALDQPLVMVVDDDPDLCANLWDLLRDRGYRVCVAHEEQAAAERLKDRDYKVVLIDMKLPQGDGATVFNLVREKNPGARTILITGHRSELDQLVQKVVAEGADAVCYKPFEMPRLLDTLQRLAHEQPAGKESAKAEPK